MPGKKSAKKASAKKKPKVKSLKSKKLDNADQIKGGGKWKLGP
jgi:hypothetical protein